MELFCLIRGVQGTTEVLGLTTAQGCASPVGRGAESSLLSTDVDEGGLSESSQTPTPCLAALL